MPDGPDDREELERLRKLLEEVDDEDFTDTDLAELGDKLELAEQTEGADPELLDELELKLRDVEDRFVRDQDGRRAAEESVDSEFDARLARLHERVDRAKQERDEKAAANEKRISGEASSARGAGLGLSVAYMILGVPMFGAGIGWLIDREMGTSHWLGLCTFAGAILGVTLAVVTLQRTNVDK